MPIQIYDRTFQITTLRKSSHKSDWKDAPPGQFSIVMNHRPQNLLPLFCNVVQKELEEQNAKLTTSLPQIFQRSWAIRLAISKQINSQGITTGCASRAHPSQMSLIIKHTASKFKDLYKVAWSHFNRFLIIFRDGGTRALSGAQR